MFFGILAFKIFSFLVLAAAAVGILIGVVTCGVKMEHSTPSTPDHSLSSAAMPTPAATTTPRPTPTPALKVSLLTDHVAPLKHGSATIPAGTSLDLVGTTGSSVTVLWAGEKVVIPADQVTED